MNNKTILTTATCILLSACGSSVPRQELQSLPPLVEIVSLNLAKQQAELRITHRHPKFTRETNQLSCQLAFKDQASWNFAARALPDLTPYATERLSVQFNGDGVAESQQSLPYVLDCFVFSDNFRREQVVKKGQLFPTPGEPGMYR